MRRHPPVARPVPPHGSLVPSAAVGWSHSAAISTSGHLFTWGKGQHGRLGHGSQSDLPTPRRVGDSLAAQSVVDVSCGACHTVAVTAHGLVFTFGHGAEGRCEGARPGGSAPRHWAVLLTPHPSLLRLGHGHCMDESKPTAVAALLHRRTASAFAGRSCTVFFVLASDGDSDSASAASTSASQSHTRPYGDDCALHPRDVEAGIAAPRSVFQGPRNATAEVMGASDARRMASAAPDSRQPIDTFYSGFLPGVRRTSTPAPTTRAPGAEGQPRPETEQSHTASSLSERRHRARVGDSSARGTAPAGELDHDADVETMIESGAEGDHRAKRAPAASVRTALATGPAASGGSAAQSAAQPGPSTCEWHNPALLPTPLHLPHSASVFQVSLVDNGVLCLARNRDRPRQSQPVPRPLIPRRVDDVRVGGTCAPPVTPQTPHEARSARRRGVAEGDEQHQGIGLDGQAQERPGEGQGAVAMPSVPPLRSHVSGVAGEGAAVPLRRDGAGAYVPGLDTAGETATATAGAGGAMPNPSYLYSTSTTHEGGSDGRPPRSSAGDTGEDGAPSRRPQTHAGTGTGSTSGDGDGRSGDGRTTTSDSGSGQVRRPQRGREGGVPSARVVPGPTHGDDVQGPGGPRLAAGHAAGLGRGERGQSRDSASSSQESSDHAQSVDGDIASSGSAESGRRDALRASGGHSSASWGSSADAERARSRGRHHRGRRNARAGTGPRGVAVREQQGVRRAVPRTVDAETGDRDRGAAARARRRADGRPAAGGPQQPSANADVGEEEPLSPTSLPPLVHNWNPPPPEAQPRQPGANDGTGRADGSTVPEGHALAGGGATRRLRQESAEPAEGSRDRRRRRRQVSRSESRPQNAGDAELEGGGRGQAAGSTTADGGRRIEEEHTAHPRSPSRLLQRPREEATEEAVLEPVAPRGFVDAGAGRELPGPQSGSADGGELEPPHSLALACVVPGNGGDGESTSLTETQEVEKLRADLAELRDQHNQVQASLRRQEMDGDEMRAKLARSRDAWLVVCSRYRELTLANAQLRGHAQASREARMRLGKALNESSTSVLGRAPTQAELGTQPAGGGEHSGAVGLHRPDSGGPHHGAEPRQRPSPRLRPRDPSWRVEPGEERPTSRRRMDTNAVSREVQSRGHPAWDARDPVGGHGGDVPSGAQYYAQGLGTFPYSSLGAPRAILQGHSPAHGGVANHGETHGAYRDPHATGHGQWRIPAHGMGPRQGDRSSWVRGRGAHGEWAAQVADVARADGTPSGEVRFVAGSVSGSGSGSGSSLSMGGAVNRLHEGQTQVMEAVAMDRGAYPHGAHPRGARGGGPGPAYSPGVDRREQPNRFGGAQGRRPGGSAFPDAFVDSDTILLMHNQAYRSNLDARQAPAPRAVDLAPRGTATMSFYGPLQARGRLESRRESGLMD